jgi:hypothetical protein
VEGQDEPSQRWFGRPVGWADPWWALLTCAFSRWMLGGSSRRFQVPTGFEVVWARRWDIDPCDAHVAASDSSGLFPMD